MGMYWTCPECDTVSSHDDFGPEEDDRCTKCGALLRGGYAPEGEERFNDREEYTFQRDWDLP